MDHRQCAPGAKNRPCSESRLRQGLVTVFTGDGRGKTSAAIGSAVRAAGHGLQVLVVFFMKGPDFVHGEVLPLKAAQHHVAQFGEHGGPGRSGQVRHRGRRGGLDFRARR
jgi:ATP:corrinoid adenosyltransferase